VPVPKMEYLNVSRIPDNGFNLIKWYRRDSENCDIGYSTGVIHIDSCIPKLTRCLRSLYFVVNEEIIMPMLMLSIQIRNNRYGNNNKAGCIFKLVP